MIRLSALLILSAISLLGHTAELSGVVRDPSQAAVSGVTVSLICYFRQPISRPSLQSSRFHRLPHRMQSWSRRDHFRRRSLARLHHQCRGHQPTQRRRPDWRRYCGRFVRSSYSRPSGASRDSQFYSYVGQPGGAPSSGQQPSSRSGRSSRLGVPG